MRISFTRIPTPELEEIDPGRHRRVRALKEIPPPPDFYPDESPPESGGESAPLRAVN
jgi:hypothetical protein